MSSSARHWMFSATPCPRSRLSPFRMSSSKYAVSRRCRTEICSTMVCPFSPQPWSFYGSHVFPTGNPRDCFFSRIPFEFDVSRCERRPRGGGLHGRREAAARISHSKIPRLEGHDLFGQPRVVQAPGQRGTAPARDGDLVLRQPGACHLDL